MYRSRSAAPPGSGDSNEDQEAEVDIVKCAPGAGGWTGTELHWLWITSWLPSPQGSKLYTDFQGRNTGTWWREADSALDQVPDQTPLGSSILQALPGHPQPLESLAVVEVSR